MKRWGPREFWKFLTRVFFTLVSDFSVFAAKPRVLSFCFSDTERAIEVEEKIISEEEIVIEIEEKSVEQKALDIIDAMHPWRRDYALEIFRSAILGSKKPRMLS